VNSPTRLSTSIVPPCCWVTMSQAIDRPSPVPSPVGFVVTKGWNNLSAGAVVAHPHFDRVTEIACGHF